jgi:hypothetical protein
MISRRVVHRSRALDFVGDQNVLLVKKQDAEFFAIQMSHGGPAIGDDRGKAAHRRAIFDCSFGKSFRRFFYDLQFGDRRLADACYFFQPIRGSGSDCCEGSETGQKTFRERLDVPSWNRTKKHKFEQFVIGERRAATGAKTLAQAVAVPKIMRNIYAGS